MTDEIRFSIEVREDAERQSPGRIVGELLTYGQRAKDRPELFERGALKWPEGGVILNRQHNRKAPIMRFSPTLDGDRLTIDAPLPNTQAGRDAAEEVRAGLFKGLSVEFKAVKQTMAGGVRRIREAVLGGAGLVDSGAYDTTVEVRHGADSDARRVLTWL